MFWQKDNASPCLISRVLENENGQVTLCYCFFYNAQGQLIQEKLVGNLSGHCSTPCTIGEDGYPQMDSIESYGVKYVYSEEDPALLVVQIEDSGLTTTYQYDASKQCTAILRGYQDHLISRCFYFYNDQGFLEKAISDDGQSQQPDDLTGVTRRQIICLQLGHQFPLIGKPLKIEAIYWEPHFADAHGEHVY